MLEVSRSGPSIHLHMLALPSYVPMCIAVMQGKNVGMNERAAD